MLVEFLNVLVFGFCVFSHWERHHNVHHTEILSLLSLLRCEETSPFVDHHLDILLCHPIGQSPQNHGIVTGRIHSIITVVFHLAEAVAETLHGEQENNSKCQHSVILNWQIPLKWSFVNDGKSVEDIPTASVSSLAVLPCHIRVEGESCKDYPQEQEKQDWISKKSKVEWDTRTKESHIHIPKTAPSATLWGTNPPLTTFTLFIGPIILDPSENPHGISMFLRLLIMINLLERSGG